MNLLCWCGNPDLQEYSPDYWRCDVCSTLVAKSFPSIDITAISEEDEDFYGKKYWRDHQVNELGLASIEERSRTDLLDRCAWWLATALEFRLPPGQLLEVGCSHGGFLALAELAGFHVTGIELSSWVVEFARKNFGVNVRTGPIERQAFAVGSFDIICMFDVLEHLQDPVRTMEYCAQALKPDGVLLAQTPQYPVRIDLGELQELRHPFLKMMLPNEHLFLFSDESVRKLLSKAGLCSCEFLPARFAQYDMMLVAAKGPFSKKSTPMQKEVLEGSGGGRLVQGFLGLFQQTIDLQTQRDDFHGRLASAYEEIEKLNGWLTDARNNADDRLDAVNRLSEELHRVCAERDELHERATLRGLIRYLLQRIIPRKH
jgi:2-polyprenyl-3-methyl-5-hydroxy-6-metoxy-1,4-benzoquinol methylase